MVVNDLNLREGPGKAAPIQTFEPGAPISGNPIQVSAGELVWILDKQVVDEQAWYQIVQNNTGRTGWISAGPVDDQWVTAYDRARCPDSLTAAMADGAVIPPFSMENLVCFGNQGLEAEVYWPSVAEGQSEVPCPWAKLSAGWLLCHESVNAIGDGSVQLTIYGTQARDDIRRGRWVHIAGHFDDPRAATCAKELGRDMSDEASVAATTLGCRSAFVVDEIQPIPGP